MAAEIILFLNKSVMDHLIFRGIERLFVIDNISSFDGHCVVKYEKRKKKKQDG